jgi:hypothetical protein
VLQFRLGCLTARVLHDSCALCWIGKNQHEKQKRGKRKKEKKSENVKISEREIMRKEEEKFKLTQID